jgi:hypothetical protein
MFVPVAGDYLELVKKALMAVPVSFDAPAAENALRAIESKKSVVTSDLNKIFREAQVKNADWAEETLSIVRQETGVWSIDGLIADKDGRVVIGPWSSYHQYLSGNPLPNMDHMRQMIEERGEVLFPLTGAKDSILMWLEENDSQVQQAIAGTNSGKQPEIEYYPVNPKVTQYLSSPVRLARIRRNVVGKGKMADFGLALGKLGFWESSNSRIAGYHPRVHIERSKAVEKQSYISPFSRSTVIMVGMLAMDEKHDQVEVVRPKPPLVAEDFIIAAFNSYEGEAPLVLRYNAYRPWFGELPHHGGDSK